MIFLIKPSLMVRLKGYKSIAGLLSRKDIVLEFKFRFPTITILKECSFLSHNRENVWSYSCSMGNVQKVRNDAKNYAMFHSVEN